MADDVAHSTRAGWEPPAGHRRWLQRPIARAGLHHWEVPEVRARPSPGAGHLDRGFALGRGVRLGQVEGAIGAAQEDRAMGDMQQAGGAVFVDYGRDAANSAI